MLSYIRDKLKTWVLGLVVILIGIPLIFLGVGDYGSNQERYAFKVDDNEVPRTVVLQEMAQFKDVLRKNYNNSIPPLYTNEFIKKITINNLIRRNIENTISKDLSLVYSDNSIINEIQNTSSFRDDSGFNPSLYKRRLFLINMSPEIYEQYIYQKGVREQLRESITNSSFITTIDKKLNITSNYAQKTGEIVSLKMSDIKNEINISLDDINNYYEQNKSSFLSNEAASFSYLRLKKSDYVNSIKISDSEIDSQYQKNLASGAYDLPNKYDINHVVFSINTNKAEVLENAKEALIDVKNGKTFDYIVNKYTVDEDTKNNNGLLSNVSISDLPDVISSSIRDMEPSQVKLITTEDNAIHLIKLLSIQTNIKKNELTVKKNIKNQLKNDKGSKQYFTVIDKIKDKLYSDKLELSEVSKNFNINLTTTPFLNKTSTYIDIPNEVITKLFSSINTNLYPPIYIDNNDILFIKKE